ncbi:probable basic-leucine zipper transcription factor S isoform X2 [Lucilia sericata]|uniref:probable basic-leucine zipper transcription factor S isoform X2 n=1 Tax=Lucilia sericata TaxID=13632 RepID=UPI0018A7F19A|nr:probable basic-leucine zipper transcription factor S isoform X2 [Lucilia sericata]
MKLLQISLISLTCIIFAGVKAFPENYSAVGVFNSGTIRQEKTNGNNVIHNVSNNGYIHQGGSNGNSVIANVDNTGYINQRKTNGNSIISNVVNTNYINQRKNTNGRANVIQNIVNHDVIDQ